MDDKEVMNEINQALTEGQPEIREAGAVLIKTLIETSEKLLADRKLEPLTTREKILLAGVASAITVHTLTSAMSVVMAMRESG